MSIRGRAAIVGFGELPTLRTYGERSALGLMAQVTRIAIDDARIKHDDIDAVITGPRISAVTVSQALGLRPKYTASMSAMGASGATSIIHAAMVVASGVASTVLCVFSEAQPKSSAAAFAAAARSGPPSLGSEWEAPFGPAVAANTGWGHITQRHMFEYGTKPEQIAKVVVDERWSAMLNENAVWKGVPVTLDDVLASRFVNDPLHLLECTMPCAAAFAVIVTTPERAHSLPNPPVYILGVGGPSQRHDQLWQDEQITTTPVAISAPSALRMAEYSIGEIDFVQCYDGYAMTAMVTLEDAGVCPKGESGNFYQSTDTTYKGAFPVNTDGGQLGAGWPGGGGTAGFRHVIEGTRQLMRRAGVRQVERADLGLINGCGGIASVMSTVILGSADAL